MPVLIAAAFGTMLVGKADTALAERGRMAFADRLALIHAAASRPVSTLRAAVTEAEGLLTGGERPPACGRKTNVCISGRTRPWRWRRRTRCSADGSASSRTRRRASAPPVSWPMPAAPMPGRCSSLRARAPAGPARLRAARHRGAHAAGAGGRAASAAGPRSALLRPCLTRLFRSGGLRDGVRLRSPGAARLGVAAHPPRRGAAGSLGRTTPDPRPGDVAPPARHATGRGHGVRPAT